MNFGLRKLASLPIMGDTLNKLFHRSHNTLEEISIEGSLHWTPMGDGAESFPSNT